MNIESKKALITGISGQDGSYLAEFLLEKGYEVHGIVRKQALEASTTKLANIAHIKDKVTLHVASLENHLSLYKVIYTVKPDECYHLAASSFVSYSFDDESSILTSNFNGTHHLLASIKDIVPECRFFFAGSSEMFGRAETTPQNEATPFNPRSVYGISKLASHHLVQNYRNQYDIFACTGILYNHESCRRDFKFVTRKITSAVAKIKLGLQDKLYLGSLEPLRDWGYAPDYVYAMWLMLQNSHPENYVIASGVNHSVRDFVECAFNYVGLDYQKYVELDPKFYRPAEAVPLRGDSSKIQEELNWQNTKDFSDLIAEMVENDLQINEPPCNNHAEKKTLQKAKLAINTNLKTKSRKMPSIFVTHHKCGSNWLLKILRSYCKTFKLKIFRTYSTKVTPPLDKQFDVLCFINSDYEILTENLKPWLNQDTPNVLHVIRNPLDIIVSGYYSHLATHPLSETWPELAHQRDILQRLDKTAGMLATWSFLERSDMHSAAHAGPLFAMRHWNYSDSRIKTLTMETLTSDHQLASSELQSLLGNNLAEILSEVTFEKLSNGRTKGVIDNNHHYRCGQPNQWVDEMDTSLAQAVYHEYKEIIDTYYPDVEALLKTKEA